MHGDAFQLHQAFGLSVGGRKIDVGGGGLAARAHVGQISNHAVGAVDARFGFGGARLWTSSQPIDFNAHAVLQRILPLGLRQQIFIFLFQEFAVISAHGEDAFGVHAVQLHHGVGDIFKKISIVADDHVGERGVQQQFLQPFNSGQVEMIRWFVEQQDIGLLHQRFCDREPLAPSA